MVTPVLKMQSKTNFRFTGEQQKGRLCPFLSEAGLKPPDKQCWFVIISAMTLIRLDFILTKTKADKFKQKNTVCAHKDKKKNPNKFSC